jgi:arginyl-tRNA synthetase
MTLKSQITTLLAEAIKDFGLETDPSLDYSADAKRGDYSTNVALVAAKKAGKKPQELAEKICEELRIKNKEVKVFEKIEVANPGFINFWVKDKKLLEHSDSLLSNDTQKDIVKSTFSGKKIVVEYTDPNPFKELHIGHLYSNIIGESLCRIFEANGAVVRRVDYFGDVGMHVAKSLWGIIKKMKDENVTLDDLKKLSLSERINFLGAGYSLGTNAFLEDLKTAEEIKDINYLVYMSGQEYLQKKYQWTPQIDYKQYLRPENEKLYQIVKELYEIGKDWSLENFENLYKRLGTKFDAYYPESIAGERGYKIVKENIANGVFVESEGAVIFPGEKQGLHNRVFINKLGLPTYEAKELGLAPWKYEEFQYDFSFIVTATEIAGYFSVLVAALQKVNPELGAKTIPLLHGMVRLPQGKMSSRSGNVVTVNWLLDEAKKRVSPLVSEGVANKEDIAESVGIAAVKYAFLRSSIGKDIVFDLEESVSFEGNSGPYLQYTYARTQSVLAKSQKQEFKNVKFDDGLVLLQEERDVLLLLVRLPDILEEAAVRYAPHILCTYLFELAQYFNLFYQKVPILKAGENKRDFRLQIAYRTGLVLKQGLFLLGIQSPERM